jgi:hypothetical protein
VTISTPSLETSLTLCSPSEDMLKMGMGLRYGYVSGVDARRGRGDERREGIGGEGVCLMEVVLVGREGSVVSGM